MDVENGKETVYYIYAAFNRAARFGDLNFHGSKYRFKRFFCLHSLPMGRLYRTSQDVLFPCKQFANLYSPTLPIWRWGVGLVIYTELIMQNQIVSSIFENVPIRTIHHEDQIWFIAQDVCAALHIKNVTQAIEKLDDDERSMFNIGRSKINGGGGEVNIINESGLFILILRSRKAMEIGSLPYRFRKWVTSEVLPSIRKTGSYALTISCDQQKKLRQAVQAVVSQTGRSYSAVYRSLHNKFNVSRYQDILAKDFNSALQYLGSMPDAPELFKTTGNQILNRIDRDGRWFVLVENNAVTYVENINNRSCVDTRAFKKLRMQTKQQAEYLVELARRMRVVDGECCNSRLDAPIEELHPKFII